jgi:hypothetical protein
MTRPELSYHDFLLPDLDLTFLEDSAFQKIVGYEGGTTPRPWFTGPALELERDSWNEANRQGLDPGHPKSVDLPEAGFLEDGPSRHGPLLRSFEGNADPRTFFNIPQPEVLSSHSVGPPSCQPYEPILNSSASSALHDMVTSPVNKLYISPSIMETSFHTRLLPTHKEPSTYMQPSTPDQQIRSYSQSNSPNQEPAIYVHTSISTQRNFDPGLSPKSPAATSTTNTKAIKGLKNVPKDMSVDPQGIFSSEGGCDLNSLRTKCPADSAAVDAGPRSESDVQFADHGELLFDLKMQPTQPRRLRKKTCEERLHSLRLRKLGGACEKHKLNKRVVSDTLPAQPPVRRLIVILVSLQTVNSHRRAIC